MNITAEQKGCAHDIAWCPADGLDGVCRKCSLYVMKPECIAETNLWFDKTFGKDADPFEVLNTLAEDSR